MHRRIPEELLIQWIDNMHGYVKMLSTDGEILLDCSCSGTGIWAKVFEMLLMFWSEEYGLPVYKIRHVWACEIDATKQRFLMTQHKLDALFKDITVLAKGKCTDVISGEDCFVVWPTKYTSGFSCKDFSKQNRNRAQGKNHLKKRHWRKWENLPWQQRHGVEDEAIGDNNGKRA